MDANRRASNPSILPGVQAVCSSIAQREIRSISRSRACEQAACAKVPSVNIVDSITEALVLISLQDV